MTTPHHFETIGCIYVSNMTSLSEETKRKSSEKNTGTWGKGASDLNPDERKIDPKVGFILAASLPLSLIVFWKITIPFFYFTISTILGAEMMAKMNFVRQDVYNFMTSPCPPWISAEERAFLDNQIFKQVKRYQELSKEEFKELVNIGDPFIVTDVVKTWSASNDWNCLEFVKRYPEAEYFDWQSKSHRLLKDITTRPGYDGLDCISGEIDSSSQENEIFLKDWRNEMPVPYFMDEDSLPLGNNESSAPLSGFIGVTGTGVPPHLEESCMNSMSVQISGVTSWSFSLPVFENHQLHWSKPMRLFLQPGEMLFWFPSMRYHSEVVDGCSLSFRFRYQTPAPNFNQVLEDLSSLPKEERPTDLEFIEKCSLVEENGIIR